MFSNYKTDTVLYLKLKFLRRQRQQKYIQICYLLQYVGISDSQ